MLPGNLYFIQGLWVLGEDVEFGAPVWTEGTNDQGPKAESKEGHIVLPGDFHAEIGKRSVFLVCLKL